MSHFIIWSAPGEPYENHIRLCLGSWDRLKQRMLPALCRLLLENELITQEAVAYMILCHDIGKLSKRWQDYIHREESERKYGPPHATLGAPYLLSLFERNSSGIQEASVLAILMHHTDSGLAQGNLEHPAEDAINRGLIEYGTERVSWADGAEEAFLRTLAYLPEREKKAYPLNSVTLYSLENVAKQMRLWARCPKEIERHQHRLQSLALHHVLKICDWRAASLRPQIEDEEGDRVEKKWHKSILRVYVDGGLLP